MLPRIIVSRGFRDYVDLRLGLILGKDMTKWRMLEYLLFGTRYDELTGGLIANTEVLASIAGQEKEQRHRHFNGEAFLKRLKAEGLQIEWWRHDAKARRSRVLKPFSLFPVFREVLDEELRKPLGEDAVYFDDGSRFRREDRRAENQRQRAAVEREVAGYHGPAQQLLAYLNHLPATRYTQLLEHMPAAYGAVEHLTDANPERLARLKRQQRQNLRAIEGQAQPFYHPVNNSVRIFGSNYNITGLKQEVRRALTPDWYELDLKQSQLSICAALWPIPEVQAFLANGGRIWTSLFDYFGIGETQEVKGIFKDALYGTLYGMSEDSLVNGSHKYIQGQRFTDYEGLNKLLLPYGLDNGGTRFLQHPLIRCILAARQEKMQAVIAQGGVQTVFGQEIAVRAAEVSTIRSALVQEAQAMELELLSPVIEMAQHMNDFTLSLWQHDGFSLAVRDNARARAIINRLSQAVERKAAEYSIITMLEVSGRNQV